MNPFKKNGYMLPIASINSVYVDDVLASDVFRPAILIKSIEQYREQLGIGAEITGEDLLYAFNDALISNIITIRQFAIHLANQFGDDLAKVFVTLKKPSELSIKNRTNWEKVHWDYWQSIQKIYLVGGLTSPLLTKVFRSRIQKAFKEESINDLQISFIEGSSNLGTKGLSTLISDGEYLLFDFGQTNIKRAYYIAEGYEIKVETVLPSLKSDYLFYKYRNHDELLLLAKNLDKYILSVIMKSIKEVGFSGKRIFIAIANYVYNGKIYESRGGYGKLAMIEDNYQSYLSNVLSKELDEIIEVKLYHDTSAMALLFKDEKNSAVISLGTAFGVAFTD